MTGKKILGALLQAGTGAALLACAQGAAALQFGLTDLGLGSATALNDRGDVVGTSDLGATLWTHTGSKIGIGSLLPPTTTTLVTPTSINDLGQIVGNSVACNPRTGCTGTSDAFYWTAGSGMHTLASGATVSAINNNGVATGSIDYRSNAPSGTFAWNSGNSAFTYVNVPPTATAPIAGVSINNQNQVVGTAYASNGLGNNPAFFWDVSSGQYLTYANPAGPSYDTIATAVNDSEQVVGYAVGGYPDFPFGTKVLLWNGTESSGTVLFSSNRIWQPAAINNDGEIVGSVDFGGGFYWSAGTGELDLDSLLSAADQGQIDHLGPATDINDLGQIIATAYFHGSSAAHAVLLTPVQSVPEPATWTLWALGLAAAGGRVRQRRVRVAGCT
jgi:hypothetical protein